MTTSDPFVQPQSARPWTITAQRVILDRSPYGIIWDEDIRLPNGEAISNFMRIELRPFVVIFAVADVVDGTGTPSVPLIEIYRLGPRQVAIELPAGGIEDGEEPLAAAQRELREETGMEAKDWQSLGTYYMDSNREAGVAHIFLARYAHPIQTPNSGDLGDMLVHLVPYEIVRDMWHNGQIRCAPQALAVALALNVLESNDRTG